MNNNNVQARVGGRGPLGRPPRALNISSTETVLVTSVTQLVATLDDERALLLLLEIYTDPTWTRKNNLLGYVKSIVDDVRAIHAMRFGGNFQRLGARIDQIEAGRMADAVEAMFQLKNETVFFAALPNVLPLYHRIRDTLPTTALTDGGRAILTGFLAQRNRDRAAATAT